MELKGIGICSQDFHQELSPNSALPNQITAKFRLQPSFAPQASNYSTNPLDKSAIQRLTSVIDFEGADDVVTVDLGMYPLLLGPDAGVVRPGDLSYAGVERKAQVLAIILLESVEIMADAEEVFG